MEKIKIRPQCAKCPWKKSVNPTTIPNGYSRKKHQNLKRTISEGMESFMNNYVMGCHEKTEVHCTGWMVNQLGVGNNIRLRLKALKYDLSEMEVFGEQHQTFEDTLKIRRTNGENRTDI